MLNCHIFFVGDEAFAVRRNLLRLYGGRNLSNEKLVFNYRLSRARRYAECSFGILTNKRKIFHRPLNVSVNSDFAVDITKACIVSHSYVRNRCGYNFEDTVTITGLEGLPHEPTSRGGLAANNIRKVLSDYFMSDTGAVPWQHTKI
jgi:hypothetical protein